MFVQHVTKGPGTQNHVLDMLSKEKIKQKISISTQSIVSRASRESPEPVDNVPSQSRVSWTVIYGIQHSQNGHSLLQSAPQYLINLQGNKLASAIFACLWLKVSSQPVYFDHIIWKD